MASPPTLDDISGGAQERRSAGAPTKKQDDRLSFAEGLRNVEEMQRLERLARASGIMKDDAPPAPQPVEGFEGGRPEAGHPADSDMPLRDGSPRGQGAGSQVTLCSKVSRTRTVVRGQEIFIAEGARMRYHALQVLTSQKFDSLMGVIIVLNSITIGLEMSFRLEGQETGVLEDLEHFFLSAYLGELLLRFYAFRASCLSDPAVIFDCVLVVSGALVTWLMPLTGFTEADGLSSGVMVVLRTLRMMRLARTVRLLTKFRELWMLVRGLINSASTMFYTCILLIIVLYVLACVGVELISFNSLAIGADPDEDFQKIVHQNFESVSMTMMTLVQFVCLDSIASIYKPLIQLDPFLLLYFMGTILVIGIVLMNLVTAVVVNSAMEQATQDKEAMLTQRQQQKDRLLKEMRKLFRRLDEDGSGQVNRNEILGITDADRQFIENTMSISNPTEIFDALDIDGSGTLEIDEFCDGIWEVSTSKAPIEIKRIEKQVTYLLEQLKESHEIQASTWQAVQTIHKLYEQQARQPWTAPPVLHSGKIVVPGGPASADAPGGQTPLPIASPSSTPLDIPSWAKDLTLELRQSLQEVHEVVLASTSAGGVAGPLPSAAPASVEKLTASLWQLHEPISSLLAEMGAIDGVVLHERGWGASLTSTLQAQPRSMSAFQTANENKLEIPGVSAELETLDEVESGHELARPGSAKPLDCLECCQRTPLGDPDVALNSSAMLPMTNK